MTAASEVVQIQAGILDGFREVHPEHRNGPLYGLVNARMSHVSERFPRSFIGDLCDQQWSAQANPRDTAIAPHVFPMVAHGLARGRTYRVQENMSQVITERATTLTAAQAQVFDDGIRPPLGGAGFVWLEQTIPYRATLTPDTAEPGEPGIGAISWQEVALQLGPDGRPGDLIWIVTAWDDLHRSHWRDADNEEQWRARFIPVMVQGIRASDSLQHDLMDHRDQGAVRSPMAVLLAMWQLFGETIPAGPGRDTVESSTETTDRRTMRKARNAGMDAAQDNTIPEVTTVVLRRESRPVINPGSGRPMTSRCEIEAYEAWRWVGSAARGDRRRVRRMISKHWSNNDESLPVRQRTVVRELRR